ncbi:MAG: HU family DNA-binding protein [bacterium]|nr:HU family DNA-binding protein [bacterium]
MSINKRKLAKIITARLDGTISQAVIYDAIGIICDDLFDKLSNNESVSISNFGTLDPYTQHGHDGMDISSGEINYVKPVKSIKFIPHDNLAILLNQNKKKFRS